MVSSRCIPDGDSRQVYDKRNTCIMRRFPLFNHSFQSRLSICERLSIHMLQARIARNSSRERHQSPARCLVFDGIGRDMATQTPRLRQPYSRSPNSNTERQDSNGSSQRRTREWWEDWLFLRTQNRISCVVRLVLKLSHIRSCYESAARGIVTSRLVHVLALTTCIELGKETSSFYCLIVGQRSISTSPRNQKFRLLARYVIINCA